MERGDAITRLSSIEGVARPLGPYSQVVVAGSDVYVSGQVAVDPSGRLVGRCDPLAQARQAYSNLGTVLSSVGSGWGSVVKLTVYLTDMANLRAASRARTEQIGSDDYPASTVLEVRGLADPDWLIEVEAIARTARARSS